MWWLCTCTMHLSGNRDQLSTRSVISLECCWQAWRKVFCDCYRLATDCYRKPLDKSAQSKNNFLISQPKYICCWYSKEPSQWDGSFQRPRQMIKLMDKNNHNCTLIFPYLSIWWRCQWRSQNAEKVTHIKGGLLDQAMIYSNCVPF